MSGKFHYFSFGSNLCVDRIRINNKSAEFFCVGLLKGYKFAFQRHSNYWKGATANILRDSDEVSLLWAYCEPVYCESQFVIATDRSGLASIEVW